jgi:hypothetical protein
VYEINAVQVAQTIGDIRQLQESEGYEVRSQLTYQSEPINLGISFDMVNDAPMWHPYRNHGKLELVRRPDSQKWKDVGMR